MHEKKHYHKFEAAYDLSWLLFGESMDRGSTFKTAFPEIVESYLKNGEDEYIIPLGFILYDYHDKILSYDRREVIETALPNELYKQLNLVVSLFKEFGYHINVSDIVRFIVWARQPKSIAPNGDDLTGFATISLPTLVWLSKVCTDDVQLHEHKSRPALYPDGMRRYDRISTITQLDGFIRVVESIFTNGDWQPSVVTRLVKDDGMVHHVMCVKVVKRVDDADTSSSTSGPNSLN